MPRLRLTASLALALGVLASCGGSEPPPPAVETPYPVSVFPYPDGTTVSLEGRNESGRVTHEQIDALTDPVASRAVACRMPHGSTASVAGAQYQSSERRWYLFLRQESCEGYVPEALVRKVG